VGISFQLAPQIAQLLNRHVGDARYFHLARTNAPERDLDFASDAARDRCVLVISLRFHDEQPLQCESKTYRAEYVCWNQVVAVPPLGGAANFTPDLPFNFMRGRLLENKDCSTITGWDSIRSAVILQRRTGSPPPSPLVPREPFLLRRGKV
jgi:hypothetical protein